MEKNMVTIDDIIALLDKYHQKYEVSENNKSIILYDKGDGSYTVIGIGDDYRYVSYEGKIIGGLKELEKVL